MNVDSELVTSWLKWLGRGDNRFGVFCKSFDGSALGNLRDGGEVSTYLDRIGEVANSYSNIHRLKQDDFLKLYDPSQKGKPKDEQVESYRYLYVDVDVKKADGFGSFCSTDEEHEETRRIAEQIRLLLHDLPTPAFVDSGNGHTLLFPITLPNTDENRQLIKSVLVTLKQTFPSVDSAVHDPSRITGIVGTWNRGKKTSDERPHRQRRLVEPLPLNEPMDAEAFTAWAKGVVGSSDATSGSSDATSGSSDATSGSSKSKDHAAVDEPTTKTAQIASVSAAGETTALGAWNQQTTAEEATTHVRNYLNRCGQAVEGSGGYHQTFGVLCGIFDRVGSTLPLETVLRLVVESPWNERNTPPWEADELRPHLQRAEQKPRRAVGEVEQPLAPAAPTTKTTVNPILKRKVAYTDIGAAELFHEVYNGRFSYCPSFKSWMVWDGRRWRRDEGDLQTRLAATNLVRYNMLDWAKEIPDDAKRTDFMKFVQRCHASSRQSAMIDLAEPMMPVTVDEMDRDPMLLNVLNGTINLRDGSIRPHDPKDFITKVADVVFDPHAVCPTWTSHVTKVMGTKNGEPRPENARYLQAVMGYAMLGEVREKIFVLLHGPRDTGKSKTVEAVAAVLGDYAAIALRQVLLKGAAGANTPEIADLFGVRYAYMSEVDEDDGQLNEEQIKRLVGQQRLKAMRKFENPFEFDTSHTIFVDCNSLPRFKGGNDVAHKCKIVPFEYVIPPEEIDKDMTAKLKAESSGILNWLLEGLRDYWQNGMVEPSSMLAAVEEWTNDNDELGQFIDDKLIQEQGMVLPPLEVYTAYQSWCEANGVHHPMKQKTLTSKLKARLDFGKYNGVRGFKHMRRRRPDDEEVCSPGESGTDNRPF